MFSYFTWHGILKTVLYGHLQLQTMWEFGRKSTKWGQFRCSHRDSQKLGLQGEPAEATNNRIQYLSDIACCIVTSSGFNLVCQIPVNSFQVNIVPKDESYFLTIKNGPWMLAQGRVTRCHNPKGGYSNPHCRTFKKNVGHYKVKAENTHWCWQGHVTTPSRKVLSVSERGSRDSH